MGVSLLLWRLVHSPFGRVVKAIKQNETRARFVGYDVWRYKAATLVISAGLSGLAGGLFAMAQTSAFPDVMSLHYSGYVVMMTLVGGGLVSFWGPVIGAVVFFLARDVIGALTTGWMLWFGLLFVVLVLFKPEGIAGMLSASGLRERKPKPGQAARRQPAAAGEVRPWRCSRPRTCTCGSATASCWRMCRSPSRPGRLSGIMGPNGAGKTTCFNVLTGRYKPDRGRVLLEGRDITGRPPHEIARLGVARSFQLMSLFDEFTVFENVAIALPATRARGGDPLGQAYADPAAGRRSPRRARPGRPRRPRRRPGEVAVLRRRRALEIAVALACRPKLLFLDEPTAGLGSDGRARLAELIAQLKGAVTIVIIEHDMEFLFSLADEISVIHWGQVIARGTPAELKTNPWVQASNLGRLH